MTIYILRIKTLIEYEFEECENFYFLSAEARAQFREEYIIQHTRDGKWIPNINSIDFEEDEGDLSYVKDEMTLEQFEALFEVEVDTFINKDKYISCNK